MSENANLQMNRFEVYFHVGNSGIYSSECSAIIAKSSHSEIVVCEFV